MTRVNIAKTWYFLGCLVLLFVENASAQGLQLQDQIDAALTRAMPSVVRIKAGDGLGTGFLVGDNLVVTNHHVIEGNEEDAISVLLSDGRVTTARPVHYEQHPDIAVLKLEERLDDMPRGLKFADMSKVRPGLLVLSIGHPGGLENSISMGVVSAIGRPGGHLNEYFLQTDATINTGNSGGPLVNLKGEVVGISTVKLRSVGGQEMDGISFALVGNIAERITKDIQQRGKVVRAHLGLEELSEVTGPEALEQGVPHGTLRLRVNERGTAFVVGLRDGDILIAIDEQPVKGIHSFWVRMHRHDLGSKVKLAISREGKMLEVSLPLHLHTADFSWNDVGVAFSQDLQVYEVNGDSPFAPTGLRPGDALIRVRAGMNKPYQELRTLDELRQAVQQSFVQGLPLGLVIKRQGRLVELKPADFSFRMDG